MELSAAPSPSPNRDDAVKPRQLPCCLPVTVAAGDHTVGASVRHFVQTQSPSGPFTEYRVRVASTTQTFSVYRRFRAFFDVHANLKIAGLWVEAPFPARSLFPVQDRETLEYRRHLLDDFVKELVTRADFLAHHSVHEFLELHRLSETAPVPVDQAFSDDESDGDSQDEDCCETSISTMGMDDGERQGVPDALSPMSVMVESKADDEEEAVIVDAAAPSPIRGDDWVDVGTPGVEDFDDDEGSLL